MKTVVLHLRFPLLLLGIAILLCGCSPTLPTRLTYADAGFTITVRGHMTRTAPDGYVGGPALTGQSYTNQPLDIAATVTVAPSPSPTSHRSRALTVRFTAPDTLQGLTVTRRTNTQGETEISVSQGTSVFTVEGGDPDRLCLLALALLPEGDITTVSPTENGVYTVTLTSGRISRILTFTSGQDLPSHVRMEHPDGWVELYVDP